MPEKSPTEPKRPAPKPPEKSPSPPERKPERPAREEKSAPSKDPEAEASRRAFLRHFKKYVKVLLIIAALGLAVMYAGAAMFDRIYASLGSDLDAVDTETVAVQPTPEPTPEPAPAPTPERATETSPGPVKLPCDEETTAKLTAFADVFIDAYYNYFGTQNADYYYQQLLPLVAQECELKERMDSSYWDHEWINTNRNSFANKALVEAYMNEDGSYTAVCSLDITEYADYWTYEDHLELKIICVADETSYYGFRAVRTE